MSYVAPYPHCVFGTKERPVLILPELRDRALAEFPASGKKHRISYEERYLRE